MIDDKKLIPEYIIECKKDKCFYHDKNTKECRAKIEFLDSLCDKFYVSTILYKLVPEKDNENIVSSKIEN